MQVLESLQMLLLLLISQDRHLWMQTAICALFTQTRVELPEEGWKSGTILKRAVCVEARGASLSLSRRRNRSRLTRPWLEWRRLIGFGLWLIPRSLQVYLKKASASTCALTPTAPPLSGSVSARVSASLRACRPYPHCTSAVVMELICWWWIIHTRWRCGSARQTAAPAWLTWRWAAHHLLVIQATKQLMECRRTFSHVCSIGAVIWEGIRAKQPI